jgi:hypothetical protein
LDLNVAQEVMMDTMLGNFTSTSLACPFSVKKRKEEGGNAARFEEGSDGGLWNEDLTNSK